MRKIDGAINNYCFLTNIQLLIRKKIFFLNLDRRGFGESDGTAAAINKYCTLAFFFASF